MLLSLLSVDGCQVEISATDRQLVQRSLVCLGLTSKPQLREVLGLRRLSRHEKNILTFDTVIYHCLVLNVYLDSD